MGLFIIKALVYMFLNSSTRSEYTQKVTKPDGVSLESIKSLVVTSLNTLTISNAIFKKLELPEGRQKLAWLVFNVQFLGDVASGEISNNVTFLNPSVKESKMLRNTVKYTVPPHAVMVFGYHLGKDEISKAKIITEEFKFIQRILDKGHFEGYKSFDKYPQLLSESPVLELSMVSQRDSIIPEHLKLTIQFNGKSYELKYINIDLAPESERFGRYSDAMKIKDKTEPHVAYGNFRYLPFSVADTMASRSQMRKLYDSMKEAASKNTATGGTDTSYIINPNPENKGTATKTQSTQSTNTQTSNGNVGPPNKAGMNSGTKIFLAALSCLTLLVVAATGLFVYFKQRPRRKSAIAAFI